MSGFDDIFADVQFPDMTITPDGEAKVDEAGQADEGSQAADQKQAINDSGQKSETHTDTKVEGKDTAETLAAKDTGEGTKEVKKDEGTKPPPYDQDPKWKKARAAEKQLDELLEKGGYLDVTELVHDLETGKGLAQKLAGRDVEKLLDAADKYGDARRRYETDAELKRREGESQDETLKRLEEDNAKLQAELNSTRDIYQSQEAARQAIDNFGTEVDRVLDVLEEPFSDDERQMALLLMGVNNPANMIDIEDRVAVRSMAKQGAAAFKRFVAKVQQDAVDKYAAGKSKLTVTSQQQTSETGSKAVQKKESRAADPNASVDDVFADAEKEFAEVLQKGIDATV